MNCKHLLPLLAAGSLILSSCATQKQTKEAKADNAEYEYVTPLGSNIPVRVRKGEKAQTSSPTGSISGARAEDLIHGAGGQMSGAQGAP